MSLVANAPTYEELQERVAYYEDLLGISENSERYLLLVDAFGMPPGPTWLLSRLIAADGRLVPRASLLDAIPSSDRSVERTVKAVDVYMVKIRRVLGFDAIETVWAQGYRLTPLGRLRTRMAIEAAKAL